MGTGMGARSASKGMGMAARSASKGVRRPLLALRAPKSGSQSSSLSGSSGSSGSPGSEGKPVAFVFGPETAAVSERLVFEATREAHAKQYSHLYVIGFAIQPNARQQVEQCEAAVGIPATYV